MIYYLYKWEGSDRSLYEVKKDTSSVVAICKWDLWRLHRAPIRHLTLPVRGVSEITEEEAAMILFQCAPEELA